jgi:hypothetical protein
MTAVCPLSASAQDTGTPKTEPNARNAEPMRAGLINASYLANFLRGGTDKSYYRLDYLGKTLTEKGTAFQVGNTNLAGSDIVNGVLPPPLADPGGDVHDLALRLERGTATGRGDLFTALGVRPFRLASLNNIRGVLDVSGLTSLKRLNLAGGIETAPWRPFSALNGGTKKPAAQPGPPALPPALPPAGAAVRPRSYTSSGITNFIVFGLLGERQNREVSEGGNTDGALATYRAFIGQTYGWKQSRQTGKISDLLVKAVLDKGKTANAAIAWRKANLPPAGELDTSHVHVVIAMVDANLKSKHVGRARPGATLQEREELDRRWRADPAADSPTEWEEGVREFVRSYTARRTEHPTYGLWLESAGWYTVSGTPNLSRFQNIYAATFTWWLDPDSSNDLKLQIRYENGFLRADPVSRRHFLGATIGLTF